MKKAAFFVEGQTELIFVRRLIAEIAGTKNVNFEAQRWIGKKFVQLTSQGDVLESKRFHVLIVDCSGDSSVKTAIIERRPNLLASGYHLILGLRDLYPFQRRELKKLQDGLSYGLPTANLPTHICVAVMEIEAWFIQEENHYPLIDIALNKSTIKTHLRFDIDNDCAEDIRCASKFLDNAYKIAGKRYNKSYNNALRTVNSLDCANLYLNLPSRLNSLSQFTSYVDQFLT